MKEIYYLNQKNLPTIPVPHDCVIKEIHLENNYIILIFEDDISYHDSIKNIRPDAKSLIIKIHLVDDIDDISLFIREELNRILHKAGSYKEYDISEDDKILRNMTKQGLEYLYHNIGYCSIIIKMWSAKSVIFDVTSDFIEYDWTEGSIE